MQFQQFLLRNISFSKRNRFDFSLIELLDLQDNQIFYKTRYIRSLDELEKGRDRLWNNTKPHLGDKTISNVFSYLNFHTNPGFQCELFLSTPTDIFSRNNYIAQDKQKLNCTSDKFRSWERDYGRTLECLLLRSPNNKMVCFFLVRVLDRPPPTCDCFECIQTHFVLSARTTVTSFERNPIVCRGKILHLRNLNSS